MEKIKIGYKTYDIVYDNEYLDEKELTGEIDYYNKKIIVRNDRDEVEFLNTFIHEVLHGIFYQSGDRNLKEDENLINCIANGLTQVIVDNDIKDILNVKSKIDKYENWIGKKVNCWDEEKDMRQNIMTYIGLGEDDSMPYKCNDKNGLVFVWKNIELADDKNA